MESHAPTRTYGFGTVIAAPYDQAVERARDALKEQGFGVITEVDIQKTMQEKLHADFRPYVILGACNPALAHRALTADLGVGLLLPCNVIVYDNGDGTSTIEALDPVAALRVVGEQRELDLVAREARKRLQAMIARLGRRDT